MKKIVSVLLIVCGVLTAGYSDAEIEKKVTDLLNQMTLDEKIGQMNQYSNSWDLTGPKPDNDRNEARYEDIEKGLVGSMLNVNYVKNIKAAQELALKSRLKIPLMFGVDVIHGYKTIFPIPIGLSSSWDMTAIEKAERIAAREASAAGLNWTFSPMVDISRDPRWGRVMEAGVEDPYLGAQIAKAKVRGYQGHDLSDHYTIAACMKHFAAYGAPNAGREYHSVDVSLNSLYNVYLPPFKAAVEAGASTAMNAFNTLNGVPATGNQFLVNQILRSKWGWKGVIVSDWGSIGELRAHGTAKDLKHCAEIGINGNTDIDMESLAYHNHLKELVEEGVVRENQVDEIVKRILTLKYKLGLFDDPFRYLDEKRQTTELLSEENRRASREIAKKTFVLLKNNNNLLPLSKNIGSIALIGPLVKDENVSIGNWACQGGHEKAVPVFDGFQRVLSEKTELLYAMGCDIYGDRRKRYDMEIDSEKFKAGFAEAVDLAQKAEVIVAVVGETRMMSGEASSRLEIDLPGVQNELLMELKKIGKPLVVILMSGRPLTIPWIAENADAILVTWHAGIEAGNAIAETVFGDANPSGKLTMTFPRCVGQIPIYYNQLNTGRPKNRDYVWLSGYIDGPNSPLYPFGYGLSYSTFEYGDPILDKSEMGFDETLTVTIAVTNTGKRDGEEVVQLYIHDQVSSIARPVKELKDFQKVFIRAGETKIVKFEITREKLIYYDENYEELLEPGDFEVMIGTNSDEVKTKTFTLK
ncbi:MAG: beta-glucosidase BglX [Candidatus Marinimicrobia bacterium]|nr:beta-glucosidase BglX [Candidatus Neomarinimicrobiota bacterium]